MRMRLILCLGIVLSVKAQNLNYYFGNLHAHTGFSDGNKDSLISGVSRPDGSYLYAKQSQNFDFLGISEHNHYSSANNPGFEKQNFPIGLNMANQANQDGTFLCLFGIEYGVSSGYNGHVVIYGFNQLIGWETGNYDVYNAKSDYDGLFRKVKNMTSAFCYLAHPYHTDYSSDGTFSGALAYQPYNAAYDSAIVGLPLRSGLAFSQATDYSDYATGDYLSYFKRLLAKGYHLGIGYDHDNHYTNFGRSNGGRLVIRASSLTRANLVYAMQNMHFYGSDDPNARLDFQLNGAIMGSSVQGTTYPSIQITHNDPDGENADSIKIWRGTINQTDTWAEPIALLTANNSFQYTDYNITSNKDYYYFAEVKQEDGQLIVTSPIWYKGLAPLGLPEQDNGPGVLLFPNPVKHELHLSFRNEGHYRLELINCLGQVVYQSEQVGKGAVISVENWPGGYYILKIQNGPERRFIEVLVD
ncbi:MAG TPA: CehA/McbA family metallohydrolase [Bacteroidia bacterium]|nr:CehA/McbA family metallohydrolase [Bacteroidia bacterium]